MQTTPQHTPSRPLHAAPVHATPPSADRGARPAPARPPAVLPSAFELEPHLEELCDMATD